MESHFENKALEQASSAQKRKAESGKTPELSTTMHQSNYIRSVDTEKNFELYSGEEITENVTKKSKVSKEISRSSNGDCSSTTATAEGSHSTNQAAAPAVTSQESSSGLQLCIMPTIEPGSPAAQLEGYSMCLFQHLFQIAKVGKMIYDLKADMDTKQQKKTNVNSTMLKDISDIKLRKFVVFACNTVSNGDKLTPHRFVSPSAQRMHSYYPDSASCKVDLQRFLWHLFIWRLFGFSRLEVIDKLYHAITVEEGMKILAGIDEGSEKPLTVIGAYGNFRIPVEKRQVVLNGLYGLSQDMSQRLISTNMAFTEVLDSIGTHDVLFLQQGGLLSWLVVCDLAEWSLCASPTVKDLAHKIGNPPFVKGKKARGGGGILDAFFVVQEACELEFPFNTSEELQAMLVQVFDALRHAVGNDSGEIQNRDLSMADMEHMLCKLSRASKIGERKSGKQEEQ